MKKLSILFLLCFVVLGFKCNPKADTSGIYRGKFYTDVQTKTPDGAKVLSRTAINPAILPAIDEGFDNLFRIASGEPNNFTIGLQKGLWSVYLFPRSNRCEYASFLIETSDTQYDGSVWDKNPKKGEVAICVAGMAVGTTNYSILIADDVAGAAIIVQYEGEHVLLYWNDNERYQRTVTHDANNSHPILKTAETISEEIKQTSVVLEDDLEFENFVVKKGETICVLITK